MNQSHLKTIICCSNIPRTLITLLLLIATSTTTLVFASSAAETSAQEPNTQEAKPTDVQELKLATPIERELAGGQAHSYRVVLAIGQYMKLVVEQQGIDVVVRVFAPDGKQTEFDSPYGAKGPEPVLFISEAAGEYRLEVKSPQEKAAAGRYQIKLEELRAATSRDRDLIAAERAYLEGEQFRAQGTAESRAKGLKKYQEALSLWQTLGDQRKEALTLHMIGESYRQSGEIQKALGYFSQAVSLRRAIGDRQGEAESLYNTGVVYYGLGDSQKALDYYQQALVVFRATGDRHTEGKTLNAMGAAYEHLGKLPEALDAMTQSLALQRAGGNRLSEASALNNLGIASFRMGEWQKALDYQTQALNLIRQLGDRRLEAQAITNVGYLYWELGENQKALEYYNEALPLRRTTGDRSGEAYTLLSIGLVYQSSDAQQALGYYNQALSLNRALGDRRAEANALLGIGIAYRSLGDAPKALDFFNQVLPLRRAAGDPLGEAGTLNQLGKTFLSLGKHEEAARYFEEALSLQRRVGARSDEAATLVHLARAEQGRGRLSVARTQIEAALKIVESMRSKFVGQQVRTSFSASTREYYDRYISLLMQMHQQEPLAGHDATAFGANERARARILLELLTESRADIRQGVDAALLERERSSQRQLNARSDRLTRLLAGKHTEEQAAAARKEVEGLLAAYQEIQAEIRAKSPGYAALTQPQPLSLKEIQQLLDRDTLLLEYALGEERSFLWAVTPTSIKSFELPKGSEIEAQARRVHELLVSKTETLHPEVLTGLSQTLLGPVADQLGNKRLLIVSQGALQYVPFGTLPAPPPPLTSGPPRGAVTNKKGSFLPLVINNEIVSLPSASVMAVLRRDFSNRAPALNKLAVLADPVFQEDDLRIKRGGKAASATNGKPSGSDNGSIAVKSDIQRSATDLEIANFDRLPVSRREAEMITARMPKGQFLKALDFAANRETARSPELGQYQIVHFATHSLINNQHPELSGIVLSLVDESGRPQDGFLRLHEIYNLKLGADLVVLSACQTALGKDIRGEGLVGLTRGFMYAGAPRVVATLWKVSDAATAEFMSRFYENMLGKKKLSAAASLRAAQLSMRQQKQWAAPYYWGGFVLQGEWR